MKPKGSRQLVLLAVLGVLVVAVLVTADTIYMLALGRMRRLLTTGRLRIVDGVSGVLLLLGGLVLATARRP